MKKKLLITMGCSFTEGIGCWDISTFPKNFSTQSPSFYSIKELNKPNFHRNGWPNRLGKKLGYDKVINLGLGGSSTSGQVKQFFEKYIDKDFAEYDVLLVWLLTDPSRISFYKNDKIVNLMSNPQYDKNYIFDGYVKFLSNSSNFNKDLLNEQIFYRKIMKTVCELKSYNFITFHINHEFNDLIKNIISNDDASHAYIALDDTKEELRKLLISQICNHWNEAGYELVSTNMFNWIISNHPNLVETPKDSIDWEWDGEPLNNLIED